MLRYDEGLKFKDISHITGIHVSTVKSQVALALRILKSAPKRRDGSEKRKVQLEQLDIPDILQEDILEVITNVKELLRIQPVKKYESSTFAFCVSCCIYMGGKVF